MPTTHLASLSPQHWSKVLSKAFRHPDDLLEFLELDKDLYQSRTLEKPRFKMLVPLSYAQKMTKGDWNDPLLQQVLPQLKETEQMADYVTDPVGDLNSQISTGVLHKYKGRVLLITTGSCPVHCRYCFRREFPYSKSLADKKQWPNTLQSITADKTIHEVIFSGGDPLMLPDDRLKQMCTDISNIPHIKTIRFHTRVPLFLPERLNADFFAWLNDIKLQKVMVIHSNHANEIDDHVGEGLKKLNQNDITLLNQTVLLKGINDSVPSLKALMQRLFSYRVLPYYLHQLDRVQGAAHFNVEKEQAKELMTSLRNELPGYLVPRYVEEIEGELSKQTIM